METRETLPPGTKRDIMKLLAKRELSAQNLAETLSVSPAAVRQHLETLGALGLVTRRKIVTRPSRPTYLYRLSTEGTRSFPKRYDLLLTLLVEVALERQGHEMVGELVQAAGRRLADDVRDRFARAPEREHWRLLAGWLETTLGWQAETAEENTGVRRITIHQCPFHDVAQIYPPVCGLFFASLIRALCGDVAIAAATTPPAPACCELTVSGPGREAPGTP